MEKVSQAKGDTSIWKVDLQVENQIRNPDITKKEFT